MAWLDSHWEQLTADDALLWWLLAASAVVFLLSPVVAAWLVVRLPSDYFVEPRRRPTAWRRQNPALRLAIVVGKNLLGMVLLMAGLVMLLTPGQGLLTIAMGLVLLDFPGKYRLERWLVTRKPVWRSINWLRRSAGCRELERPEQRVGA